MSKKNGNCPHCGAKVGPYELHACNPLRLALKGKLR